MRRLSTQNGRKSCCISGICPPVLQRCLLPLWLPATRGQLIKNVASGLTACSSLLAALDERQWSCWSYAGQSDRCATGRDANVPKPRLRWHRRPRSQHTRRYMLQLLSAVGGCNTHGPGQPDRAGAPSSPELLRDAKRHLHRGRSNPKSQCRSGSHSSCGCGCRPSRSPTPEPNGPCRSSDPDSHESGAGPAFFEESFEV
mmetsp:Transcript_4967/g.10708  ORF Transcript_4967/g.10708 Transcript_4967/m.10708 type:complete len:200 (+) Transcript_4967:758-1357(+)